MCFKSKVFNVGTGNLGSFKYKDCVKLNQMFSISYQSHIRLGTQILKPLPLKTYKFWVIHIVYYILYQDSCEFSTCLKVIVDFKRLPYENSLAAPGNYDCLPCTCYVLL